MEVDKLEEQHGTKVPKLGGYQIATLVLSLVLVAILSVGIVFGMHNMVSGSDGDKIGTDTLAFLKANFGVDATLVSVKETSGMYNVSFVYQNQASSVFVSEDGKFILLGAVDTEAPLPAAQEQETAAEMVKTETPSIEMYVMSFCPYGQQAETMIQPVMATFSKNVDFEPHYIFYANYGGGGPNYCMDEEDKYCSMHGVQEANEDIRQICLWKYDSAKWWSYVSAINSKCKASSVDACWETVAKDLKINTTMIKECFNNEKFDLAEKEVALAASRQAKGSPTVFINGASYADQRTPEAFKTSLCGAFIAEPEACSLEFDSSAADAEGSC